MARKLRDFREKHRQRQPELEDLEDLEGILEIGGRVLEWKERQLKRLNIKFKPLDPGVPPQWGKAKQLKQYM
jgi:hypothetical protein